MHILERTTIIAVLISASYSVALYGGLDVCFFSSDRSGCGMVMALGMPMLLWGMTGILGFITALAWAANGLIFRNDDR